MFSHDSFNSKLTKTPVVEFDNTVKINNPKPKVSILLITYNHKEYIKSAVDSILRQDIPFEYEIIIGDDDSTDGTREICIDYAKKHPDIIRLFLHKRDNNIKVLGKHCLIFQFTYNLLQCRGKYIALLSGDDYWNDKDKINKQVKYLEAHKECSICFHSWAKLHDNTNTIEYLNDCKNEFPMPLTWVVRNIFKKIPEAFTQVLQEDDFMLFMLKTHGTINFIEDIEPAIYRVHGSNTWLSSDVEFKRKSEINTAVQILSTYKGTTHEHLAKVKLYKALKKYVSDNRTKLKFPNKLFLKTKYQIKYKLTSTIIKIELEKWSRRITNRLKISIKKTYSTFIKLNSLKLDKEKATIVSNTSIVIDTGIYKTNHKYIFNSFFGENKINTLSAHKYLTSIEEQEFFCGIQHGSWDNYYHWYIDSLPRLWHLHNTEIKALNQPVKLYLSKKLSDEGVSILKNLLPNYVTIQWCEPRTIVKGKQALYLPFLSKDCSGALPIEYLQYYLKSTNELFQMDKKKDYPTHLFVSRKGASKRLFNNEQEVRKAFTAKGYEILEPGNLSIAEQAAYFYHSKVIVAQHGAALTNLLYATSATVFEIFHAPNSHLNHYRDLCTSKELNYHAIYLGAKHKDDNVHVDVKQLINTISTCAK